MELWAVHVADGSPAPFPSGRPNVESDEEVIFPSPIAGTVALATSQRPMALQLWAEFNHFIATTLPSKRLSVTYPKQQHGQHNEEAKTPQTAPMVPQLWLSRHGQSMSNLTLRIGEDSPLSPNGQQYALWLNKKMQEITSPHVYSNLHVWTSHLQRTLQVRLSSLMPLLVVNRLIPPLVSSHAAHADRLQSPQRPQTPRPRRE